MKEISLREVNTNKLEFLSFFLVSIRVYSWLIF